MTACSVKRDVDTLSVRCVFAVTDKRRLGRRHYGVSVRRLVACMMRTGDGRLHARIGQVLAAHWPRAPRGERCTRTSCADKQQAHHS